MPQVRVMVLRAPGTNCDAEAVFAFEQAGAAVDRIHINRLREQPGLLKEYQILNIAGGFTYGDDVAAGKIVANQLRSFLSDALQQFRTDGKLILGVCNGFQILLKAGLLVPPDEGGTVPATLAHNTSGKFEDRWIHMKAIPGNCHFLQGYDVFEAPVAHGEGRFVCKDDGLLRHLENAGQVVLRYVTADGRPGDYPENPNGAQGDVAGICDPSGMVLGLMPHPERYILGTQHPQWTRLGAKERGDGYRMFHNAVRFFERW